MAHERELATYKAKLPELLAHEGKWVLIHEDTVAGIWDTSEEALTQGYDRFGLNVFMIKQILANPKPIFIGRHVPNAVPY